jgi:hypothetical protein
MMGKSLSYAYAEGGSVPVGIASPRDFRPQYTDEQIKQMEEANARRIAAEASTAESRARQAALHAANPHIDFSEAGHAAALADAQRIIAEAAAREGVAGNPEGITSVTEGDVTFSGNPDHFMVGEFNQQPVDTTGGFNVGDVTLPNATVTPEYQAQSDFTYTPPPTTFTELTGIGENAGQSGYQEFIEQNPQQTATQYSTYTPPEFQGVGSYLTPQQGSYLMYSTPGSVFKRPEGG